MNTALAASLVQVLKAFDTEDLCALNNAITGWGRVAPSALGFQAALDAKLIQHNGVPFDRKSLEAALALEVERRLLPGEDK